MKFTITIAVYLALAALMAVLLAGCSIKHEYRIGPAVKKTSVAGPGRVIPAYAPADLGRWP